MSERDNRTTAASPHVMGSDRAEIERLRAALTKISSPTQSTDLLWWQIEARAALSATPASNSVGSWLPIERADKTITNVEDFSEVGVIIRTSDRYWVRDDDGRVYEAAWSENKNGRDYWWDFEGESPVDPVEFMPHPLDPRFASAEVEG